MKALLIIYLLITIASFTWAAIKVYDMKGPAAASVGLAIAGIGSFLLGATLRPGIMAIGSRLVRYLVEQWRYSGNPAWYKIGGLILLPVLIALWLYIMGDMIKSLIRLHRDEQEESIERMINK